MKQTQNTHVCSLAREGAAPYSLARGVLATNHWGKWRGSGVLYGMRGKATTVSRAGRKTSETVAKQKQ